MDSDDYIEPDMMQSHYNCVIANKTDVVVSGVIRENVLTNERSRKNLTHAKLYNRGDIARYLELLDIESHDLLLNYVWNKWIRKQVIDNNNLTFRESWRWSEDYLFNCSMFHFISSLCILGDAFYHYCIQGNESLVKKFDVNTLSRIKIMDQALAKMYESYGIKDNCNYFMMCNSGRCCLNAIYKVCTPSCQLSLKAKHAYIKDFLMNERGQAIQCYLNSLTGKRKIKNLPTIIGCKMKNSHIMYLLALLRSRKQYVADIYYSGRKRR